MLQISEQSQKYWAYVFLRTDLPISQQAIQAAHAALELGIKYGPSPDGHPSLVFLETKSSAELHEALLTMASRGIQTFQFHEPYQDWGLTAFACEPIPEHNRRLFKDFQLWRKL